MRFPVQKHLLNHRKAAKWLEREVCFMKIGDRCTLTIHAGALCLQPKTLSVRIIPVTGSIDLSIVSMLTTCVHFEFGYLCHMPITTWDQG